MLSFNFVPNFLAVVLALCLLVASAQRPDDAYPDDPVVTEPSVRANPQFQSEIPPGVRTRPGSSPPTGPSYPAPPLRPDARREGPPPQAYRQEPSYSGDKRERPQGERPPLFTDEDNRKTRPGVVGEEPYVRRERPSQPQRPRDSDYGKEAEQRQRRPREEFERERGRERKEKDDLPPLAPGERNYDDRDPSNYHRYPSAPFTEDKGPHRPFDKHYEGPLPPMRGCPRGECPFHDTYPRPRPPRPARPSICYDLFSVDGHDLVVSGRRYLFDEAIDLCRSCVGTDLADVNSRDAELFKYLDEGEQFWVGSYDGGQYTPYLVLEPPSITVREDDSPRRVLCSAF